MGNGASSGSGPPPPLSSLGSAQPQLTRIISPSSGAVTTSSDSRAVAAEPPPPPPHPATTSAVGDGASSAPPLPSYVRGLPVDAGSVGLGSRIAQGAVLSFLGFVSASITHVLNRTTVLNGDAFGRAHGGRAPGQGLITACNHASSVDDPGVIMPLLPWHWLLLRPERVRWTLCASDRCFGNALSAAILRHGRVLPVERGRGVRQPLMDECVARLERGDWVHIFPEGARQAPGAPLGQMRAGIGRLIADASPTPLVLPFAHAGMHALQPKGQTLPLAAGHEVHILLGEPLDLSAPLAAWRAGGVPEEEVHRRLAEAVGDAIRGLKEEVERVHAGKGGGAGGTGGARVPLLAQGGGGEAAAVTRQQRKSE